LLKMYRSALMTTYQIADRSHRPSSCR
jgi:hypothetical protein